ncbi:MAG: CHAT domain-containing protein [Anaerolineae bacterium]|nr:CHAT domain-containing protein [Anaerolineae bacterium]
MSAILRVQLSYVSSSAVEVRVEESACGEPRQVVEMPLRGPAIQTLLKVLEAGDLRYCSLSDAETETLRTVGILERDRLSTIDVLHRRAGGLLFDAVFPGSSEPDHDVRAAFMATLAQAELHREPMCLQLRFDRDAVDLASLPWELLNCKGEQLVSSGRVHLTRYVTFGQATAPYPVTNRLEVLTITARPRDALTLDTAAETDAIKTAFSDLSERGIVRIDPLSPPTLDALVAAVNAHSYHIIHFDGHGTFGRRCQYCGRYQPEDTIFCTTPNCGARLDEATLEGCLLFESNASDRLSQMVTPHELGTVLTGRQVRLFIASACQSGAVKGASVFSSIGPRLLLAGIPAVVAMQFAVPIESTVAFSAEFYASLARSESVAAAATAGRKMLVSRGTWHIPAVYLRSRDGEGNLFRFHDQQRPFGGLISGAGGVRVYFQPAGSPAPDWEALRPRSTAPYKFLSPYEAIDHLVFFGRESMVREVSGEILQGPLTVLQGPAGIGKTSLVNAGLVPRFLNNGYMVMTTTEYDNLASSLSQAMTQSVAPDMNALRQDSLKDFANALIQNVGHPLLLVFDHFEEFLRTASAEQRQTFTKQLADCIGTNFPLPVRLLLVVREDFVGRLTALDGNISSLWTAPVSLGFLTRAQARAAIEQPLARYDPPMACDPLFLDRQLLADLSAEGDGELINPTHLQIVCSELYRTAIQQDVRVITGKQYPPGGIAVLLARYLDQSLQRRFIEPEAREAARNLLKLMVSGAGERVYVSAATAAQALHVSVELVHSQIEMLREDGLLEARTSLANETTYSLSHHVLAEEVQRWFDREEVLNRCAQETLNRAWDDWYAQRFAVQQTAPGNDSALATPELLVGSNRLAELRSRRAAVDIDGPQLCLLLRSAVHHQVDTAYWAHQLAEDEPGRSLLAALNGGKAGPGDHDAATALGAAALGLADFSSQPLARAATGDDNGCTRHAASLALAALGMDTIQASLMTMAEATPAHRGWRRAQALAQMKAAGFALPQTHLTLQILVAVWSLGLRAWSNRWRIASESLLAGLGAGIGLGLALLLPAMLPDSNIRELIILRSLVITPMVVVLGVITIAIAWLFRLAPSGDTPRIRAVSQVVGVWIGFVAGLLILWWPLDALINWLMNLGGAGSGLPLDRSIFNTYILAASLWGLGISLGYQILAGTRSRPHWLRAMLGAGAGGAVGCLLATSLNLVLPLVEPAGANFLVEVSLTGFGFGAGLAGGRVAGMWLFFRLRQTRASSLVANGA